MKVVIDIDEKIYNGIKLDTIWCSNTKVRQAIIDGIVLPNDCGDLIDKDALLDELDKVARTTYDDSKPPLFWDRAVAFVHLAPTVVEADTGE